MQKYESAIKRANRNQVVAAGFFVFCPQTYEKENHINARMFDDYYGVPEDPATGSANGCLLGYLLKHNYFNRKKLELRVEQGYEITRPSLIKIKGKVLGEDEMEILVGGKVQMVAKGEWC